MIPDYVKRKWKLTLKIAHQILLKRVREQSVFCKVSLRAVSSKQAKQILTYKYKG